jgi:hypothetical protein
MELELIHGDRRQDNRYELELDLRFSYEHAGQAWRGFGRTVDLSRGGVRFRTDAPPPNGMEVELRLQWPFLLQNVIPLELVMRGSILRTDIRGTVLCVRDYAFATCGKNAFDHATAPAVNFSMTA